MRRIAILLGTLLGMAGASSAQGAEGCRVCHPKLHRQWVTSPHAGSWNSEQFKTQMGQFGSEEFCGSCHAPLSVWAQVNLRSLDEDPVLAPKKVGGRLDFSTLLAKKPPFRKTDSEEGVNCSSCHSVEVLAAGSRSNEFVGPYHTEEGHSGQRIEAFDNYQLCAGCHGRAKEDYLPNSRSEQGYHHSDNFNFEFNFGSSDCSSCHMPRSQDKLVQLRVFKDIPERMVGDHTFSVNRYAALEDALELVLGSAEASFLSITNRGVGHPLRISSVTRYRVVASQLAEEEVLNSQIIEWPDQVLLAPGETIRLPLDFSPKEGEKLQVEFLVTERPEEEERTIFSRVLETVG